jgi:hypothetical protein
MKLTKWERTLLKQQRPIDPPENEEEEQEVEEELDNEYDKWKERDL